MEYHLLQICYFDPLYDFGAIYGVNLQGIFFGCRRLTLDLLSIRASGEIGLFNGRQARGEQNNSDTTRPSFA